MLNDEMLCGGKHSSLFWTSNRPALARTKSAGPFFPHEEQSRLPSPRLTTEGPEFLPCPFSGGTAWYFLPPVGSYLVLFSVDLSIALDPNSGCRAFALIPCGKV